MTNFEIIQYFQISQLKAEDDLQACKAADGKALASAMTKYAENTNVDLERLRAGHLRQLAELSEQHDKMLADCAREWGVKLTSEVERWQRTLMQNKEMASYYMLKSCFMKK